MFEPISMSAALSLGSALAGYARSTSAVSHEASVVCTAASLVLQSRASSQSLFRAKSAALSDLAATVDDVFVDSEQMPVAEATYEIAEQLLLALPDDLPVPEIGVDPDGAVSLTWFATRHRIFSVSVDEIERIAFAWLDGSDKGHGVERFRPPVLPNRFLVMLRSIVSDGPALRVA